MIKCKTKPSAPIVVLPKLHYGEGMKAVHRYVMHADYSKYLLSTL
jgi:hypothetical protein